MAIQFRGLTTKRTIIAHYLYIHTGHCFFNRIFMSFITRISRIITAMSTVKWNTYISNNSKQKLQTKYFSSMSSSWILKASCPVLKSTEPKVYFTIHISIVLCCNWLQLPALQLSTKCTASEYTYCCGWMLCLLNFDEAAFAGSCPKARKDWRNTWNWEKGVRDWKKEV